MSENLPVPLRLTIEEEVKIVALLARGDTAEEIQRIMKQDHRAVSKNAVYAVKKRNKPNLDMIRAKLLEKETSDALANKQNANLVISKRLKREDKSADVVNRAQQDYLAGLIKLEDLVDITKRFKETSLTELVSVSKEMHNQSKEEDTKAPEARDLSALVEAIRSGDEVTLSKMTFNKPQE